MTQSKVFRLPLNRSIQAQWQFTDCHTDITLLVWLPSGETVLYNRSGAVLVGIEDKSVRPAVLHYLSLTSIRS